MRKDVRRTVAVLGAGPVGLAAAAHLLARGFEVKVFEAAAEVGASFSAVAHVRLFSPWRYNVDAAARALLEADGWVPPDAEGLPTAGELVSRYLVPLARTRPLAGRIRTDARVLHVARQAFDKVKSAGREEAPFVVQVREGAATSEHLAGAVIDATGTWHSPNPLGANGLPAIGEASYRDRIDYGMPDVLGKDRARFAGKTVLVVGAGHSAAGVLLALAQLAGRDPNVQLHWAVRGDDAKRVFGGGLADGLPARGALGLAIRQLIDAGRLELHTNFRIHALTKTGDTLTVVPDPHFGGRRPIEGLHRIVCSTGSRPDLSITRELRVRLDPWLEATEALAPLVDPNLHSCGTVRPHGHRELAHPEKGFYVVGSKSYGRAPTFLMATGYEQVRSIAAALAGDLAAADDVRLDLPETGVCSSDPDGEADPGGACCGPVAAPAPAEVPAARPQPVKAACCAGAGEPVPPTSSCCS